MGFGGMEWGKGRGMGEGVSMGTIAHATHYVAAMRCERHRYVKLSPTRTPSP